MRRAPLIRSYRPADHAGRIGFGCVPVVLIIAAGCVSLAGELFHRDRLDLASFDETAR